MSITYQICSRCILNSNVPYILFDENGVCNYCKEHDQLEKMFPLGEQSQRILEQKIEEIKKSSEGKEYDCVVGVSGGVDSTYTLYKTVELGLRPLAVLFDNGWNSEIAVSNIKNATEALNIDLETLVVDWEEFKSLLVSFLKASIPMADVPTDIGIKGTLYQYAYKNDAKYIIMGGNFRTEGKIPKGWGYMDGHFVKSIHKQFNGKKLVYFPNITLADYFNYIFIKGIKVLRLLDYVEYQREDAKRLIQEKLGWRDYGGKHYESLFTRFNQTWNRYKKFGIDMRLVEYSALIRSGQMSREEAMEQIKFPPYIEQQLEEDKEYVIKKLGLTEEEFDEIYNLPLKSYKDYPSYDPLIRATRPLVNLVNRFFTRL